MSCPGPIVISWYDEAMEELQAQFPGSKVISTTNTKKQEEYWNHVQVAFHKLQQSMAGPESDSKSRRLTREETYQCMADATKSWKDKQAKALANEIANLESLP